MMDKRICTNWEKLFVNSNDSIIDHDSMTSDKPVTPVKPGGAWPQEHNGEPQ
jgi:hypothetical protein